jgi:chorismate dehydratase
MPAMTDLRIGVVSYSNTAPLTAGLPEQALRRGVPAEVADWLAAGEVDVAIVPSIELGRISGLRALPGWGVAADGQVLSVLLFSRCPLAEIGSVALDASSRTSAALVRVLLEREGVEARFVKRSEGSLDERLEGVDAALLIGDPALRAQRPPGVTAYDLAAEWKRHVGLPFVFAVWAVRAGLEPEAAQLRLFSDSGEEGLSRLPDLAAAEALRTGLSPDLLHRYFSTLDYRLGPAHLQGLRAFLDEAGRIGVLPERREVSFYEGSWS